VRRSARQGSVVSSLKEVHYLIQIVSSSPCQLPASFNTTYHRANKSHIVSPGAQWKTIERDMPSPKISAANILVVPPEIMKVFAVWDGDRTAPDITTNTVLEPTRMNTRKQAVVSAIAKLVCTNRENENSESILHPNSFHLSFHFRSLSCTVVKDNSIYASPLTLGAISSFSDPLLYPPLSILLKTCQTSTS
jgi:hypothetical protein